MKLKMTRVILFTRNMESMTAFYRDALGLKQVTDEKCWREFNAGGLTIALHSGPPSPKSKGPKLVFYAKDIAATREALVARGVKLGKVGAAPFFLCDGRDPDGNAIQLSSR
jgi:catechol 2,3-dioxygenase-like lactoylglutathione lyase family enzyme